MPVFGTSSPFAAPYVAIVVAGLLALTAFLPGGKTPPVGVITALTVTGTIVTLFAIVKKGDLDPGTGAGAIIVLVGGILMSIAAVLWLLVDSGLVKTGPSAPATPAGGTPTAAPAAPTQPGADAAGTPYGASYGSYGAGQYGQSGYGQGAAAGQASNAPKPATDPGAAASGGPSYGGGYGNTPGSDSATTVFNNPNQHGGGQPGGGQPGGGQQSNFTPGGYGF